ncbi:putative TIR domain, P-loop containing nucleoside triphosphate hydrolase [Helianthus annuus]|nr:putative TIR domain, P-loop containing nucleoside triphosphate hydrolase [Helianthus annuus]
MASTSSSVHNKSYQYDVFLSFSGVDTRKTFVDHLYVALDQHGIRTFKDDERLQKGERISDELLQSIEDSRCYILVFSKNYASSSWCLNELLKIMECQKTNEQTAFPVFYDVDPSEVRKQTGSVGEAFAVHTDKNELEVGQWREALKEAASLSGWDVRKTANGHEAQVIKSIVEKVSLKLWPIDSHLDENLVGMEQRMQALDPYLEIGLNDVRMVGIKGMGGTGKTTLARAIFDKLFANFEGRSFVENVRETTTQSGLRKLQKQVLRDVLKDKSITVSSVHEGIKRMKTMLYGKKVLLVLDDVDQREQLEALAGNPNWFKLGSRIIITTRDGQVLEAHRVNLIHDVNLLSNEEAICLFSRHAFWKDNPPQEYERRSRKVVSYAVGLPLTIKVLGSNLRGKDDSVWTYTLERLKTIPLKETLQILELSYQNLEDDYKEIFLDVACFLRGWKKEDAIRMLESCGFDAKHGLRVLEQKSLIGTLKEYDNLWTVMHERHDGIIDMHDHLVEMGKNIIRREHSNEPNKHSRLWIQEEIKRVLTGNLVSEATRCTIQKLTRGIFSKGLGNMKKLRCLIVNHGEHKLSDDLVNQLWSTYGRLWKHDTARQYFSNSLRYLYWKKYPHWCLPKTSHLKQIILLLLKCLRAISNNFGKGKSYAKELRSFDLGLTPNLKRLDVEGCEKLVRLKVHGGCLKSLVYLNLNRCKGLKSISFIEQLESLEFLHMCGLNLKEFPNYITTGYSSNSLLELNLSWNNIEEVASSIGNLHKLVSLNLGSCFNLKSLPGSICRLQHLRTLDLSSTGIKELLEDLGQLECLEQLYLTNTKVKYLPGSICMLKHLKTLYLYHCQLLEKLPEDVGQLESLKILDLGCCSNLREIPNNICKLKCLKELNLWRCKRVEKLPDELGNLKGLQLLIVRETGITHLPRSIYSVKGLKIYKPDDELL